MFDDPDKFFLNIANKCFLHEGAQGVNRIVLEIFRRQNERITNKELAGIVRIPVPVLSAVRSELVKSGLFKTKSIISEEGLNWIKSELKLKYTQDFLQEFISGSSLDISQKYVKFFNPVIEYLKKRPSPEYKYDQSRSIPETVIKRALLMLKNGDVEGKKIVILGDDDGVSIVLAYLGCAKEIFVIDIDSRIIKYIADYSFKNQFDDILHTQLWDIRASLPKKWLQKYDTFETDPPYTVSGFKLFLNQAANLLNIKKEVRGYVSFGSKTPQDSWACQQHLNFLGFTIDEFIQNFNRYHGSTILGNTSNMYIISSVPQKRGILRTKSFNDTIYTFDEDKTKDLPTVGYQIIAEFYGVDSTFLNDIQILMSLLETGISESGLKKAEIFSKEYSPYGLSLIAILIESHCHLHTWPEHNYLSIDLFVCESAEKAEHLFEYLLHHINPVDYHKYQFFRGKPPLSS